MTNNNKILTVSYGTFSCTLEGFDDSFETMKAIAEYFRDLASDDRYFGSEPPQPDAQMLARIAEREGARRVEALEHEGRIMLKAQAEPDRQSSEISAKRDVDFAPKTAPKPKSGAKLRVVPRQDTPPAKIDEVATGSIARDQTNASGQMALQEKEDISDQNDGDAAPTVHDQPKTSEDQACDPASFFSAKPGTAPTKAYPDAYEDEAQTAPALVSAPLSKTAARKSAASHTTALSVDDASLAYKLHRIRAVVSQKDKAKKGGYFQSDGAVPKAPEPEDVEPAATVADKSTFVAEVAQEIAGVLNEDLETPQSTTDRDDAAQLIRHVIDTAPEDTRDDPVDLSADAEDPEPAGNLFASDKLEDEPEAQSHTESSWLTGADENAAPGTDLEPEMDRAPEKDTSSALSDASALDPATDKDVLRLMNKVEQQMEDPDSASRRNAFSHLRAAVTARDADTSIDDTSAEREATAQAFRDDLAQAIKPQEDLSDGSLGKRLPTLQLVAEQRVDTQKTLTRGPVAPRRVAATTDADVSLREDTGFADYAEEHNARNLTQILEAAAAYMTFVESHEQFSRPQLMTRVKQADAGAFSREEGLRAFGQLLRQGKIEKISGGRFTASDAIGYKPGKRSTG